MSCTKCKAPESKEEPLITCDKCKRKLCQNCTKLSTTEYRAASLKSGRILLYLCGDCRSSLNLNQSDNEKLIEIQNDLHTLNKKLTDFSKTTLQLIEKTNLNHNKIFTELQSLKEDMQKNIERTKQEIIIMKETNKDMIKLLSNAPKSYSEVARHATSQNRNTYQTTANKVITETTGKSATQTMQKKLIHHNSDPIELELETSGASNKPLVNNMHHNSTYKQGLIDGKIQNKNVEQFTKNTKKTKRREINIGTAETETEDEENDFIGKESNKKVWLFISRVKDHVTIEKIKNYIKKKTDLHDDSDIVVEHTKTKYDDIRKDCQCFKIGINYDKKDVVYEENFWPKKVAYRRFNFNANTQAEDNKDKDF